MGYFNFNVTFELINYASIISEIFNFKYLQQQNKLEINLAAGQIYGKFPTKLNKQQQFVISCVGLLTAIVSGCYTPMLIILTAYVTT